MVFLNNALNIISRKNKYCIIIGDWNLILLNFESHAGTNEFVNSMGSYVFHPYILQPTRITDYSATLIDNIFFNLVYHHTVSGNIIYDLIDHLLNFSIINKLSALPKNFKLSHRDYSKYNEA